MATRIYINNFVIWKHINFVFSTKVPWDKTNLTFDWVLKRTCCHGNKNIISWLCCFQPYQPLFGKCVLWDNPNQQDELLLMKPCCHGNKSISSLLCCLETSYFVHRSLGTISMYSMICCQENHVAMATWTYYHNFFV